jgi:hypothetical protein
MLNLFVIVICLFSPRVGLYQNTNSERDPLERRVRTFRLEDDTLGDALGRLNQNDDISISIEGVLADEGSVTNPKFSGEVANRTVAEILDWLCQLDGRYVWMRDGNHINLLPREKSGDPNYFFNRTITELHFERVKRVGDAVLKIDRESNDKNGGVIYMGIGQRQSFAEPWTTSFAMISVRQALNRVADQLGRTYGWQIGGTTGAKLILFHEKLLPRSANRETGFPDIRRRESIGQ